ncbi:MAG: excinuclease ABC subunit UvrA [Bacillota bacterium]|nr:excinuclease ABC subunit UvrA [Bacillota bacterium]MDD3297789.1 excinuclease ABC subunit UvrA [Bacillota bacterium]MDD3850832.1 excinuclease ABC subunit UvrA [Bacillota bacterium]MDD4707538.1 excinuclease ABC subunit UvrA [Bacillota bacterium]
MSKDKIIIRGARQHNLKNLDIQLPRDKFIVMTGLSGSGKSSLAFDTIYAEGQRRYVESLSAYARQFLGQMDKPDIDYIEGLSPAISIDQRTTSRNPRSTVGTATEIYDYLRLLFARAGTPYCPRCGTEITQQTIEQMVDSVMVLKEGTRIQLLAPIVRDRKGEHIKLLEEMRKSGYVRIRVDGEVMELGEEIKLEKNKKHRLEVVVDRLVVKEGIEKRLADSMETCSKLTGGVLIVDVIGDRELTFSQNYACIKCGISMEELSPRFFSFNSPYGACPNCNGLGDLVKVDPSLIIPDRDRSLKEGAIAALSDSEESWYRNIVVTVLNHFGYTDDTPFSEVDKETLDIILYGSGGRKFSVRHRGKYGERVYSVPVEGIVNNLHRRYKETQSDYIKNYIETFMSTIPCPACNGTRLKDEVLAVKVGDKNIADITSMSVVEALYFFESLKLGGNKEIIAHQILKEIRERLGFLVNVGLDYLTLSRASGTLSGGEAQRIRLATQIGSSLVGVLYILDEPSIGLHQRDNRRLIETLHRLTDLGNTLIVVEHDEETIRAADHILDIGPGAGIHGGRVIAEGTLEDILACKDSITGQYLRGDKEIAIPGTRRKPNGKHIIIRGAAENNLKNLDVDFPLGVFVCVTGVSGSGKSTLVNEILYKGIAQRLYRTRAKPGKHKDIEGIENIDKIIDIDQSPIGRTPRSNPATYTGVFDHIRDLFASTQESKMRGYKKGRFSFNVKGGRCEACRGDGIIKIEMHFLPDVYVPCEVCKGKRYNRETLQVRYKGKTIADVLDMTVEEALEFFQNIPPLKRKLQVMFDVGLGYIRLGQPSTQLSGGEAQRVKLATELSKRSTGKTLYILDEPTTGLHFEDVRKLIGVLSRLADSGNTIVVIEHNLDVIKTADYIIDMGPEGGDRGGTVIATGTPEEVVGEKHSYTGRFLKKVL